MANPPRLITDHQKLIAKIFDGLLRSGRHNRWTIWCDFVTLAACSLSLADLRQREKRERLYTDTAKKYTPDELQRLSEMFAEVVLAMEEEPEQDLLGELYMRLELGNQHGGQFFTPYNVCKMMAQMTASDLEAKISRKGFISVNDCCCGAGALLIAFANECRRQEINYQRHVLFVGQDIDFTAAMMCYIQLSLLGCPGYVIVGNSLTTPPTESLANLNVWYTPLYFLDIWHWRRIWAAVSRITGETQAAPVGETPPLLSEPDLPKGQLTLF